MIAASRRIGAISTTASGNVMLSCCSTSARKTTMTAKAKTYTAVLPACCCCVGQLGPLVGKPLGRRAFPQHLRWHSFPSKNMPHAGDGSQKAGVVFSLFFVLFVLFCFLFVCWEGWEAGR